jgi:hypothetical protein
MELLLEQRNWKCRNKNAQWCAMKIFSFICWMTCRRPAKVDVWALRHSPFPTDVLKPVIAFQRNHMNNNVTYGYHK